MNYFSFLHSFMLSNRFILLMVEDLAPVLGTLGKEQGHTLDGIHTHTHSQSHAHSHLGVI